MQDCSISIANALEILQSGSKPSISWLLMARQCKKLSLHWRHNDHNGVSNHQPYGCLLNRLFRRRSKKTSKLCVTGLCVGNSPGPVNSPHKGPVTRKMFPFDDVIMWHQQLWYWFGHPPKFLLQKGVLTHFAIGLWTHNDKMVKLNISPTCKNMIFDKFTTFHIHVPFF